MSARMLAHLNVPEDWRVLSTGLLRLWPKVTHRKWMEGWNSAGMTMISHSILLALLRSHLLTSSSGPHVCNGCHLSDITRVRLYPCMCAFCFTTSRTDVLLFFSYITGVLVARRFHLGWVALVQSGRVWQCSDIDNELVRCRHTPMYWATSSMLDPCFHGFESTRFPSLLLQNPKTICTWYPYMSTKAWHVWTSSISMVTLTSETPQMQH